MACWLFKEEPSHFSFDDLVRDKRTRWDGVENNLALIHLRSVAKGDRVFFYHTGDEKAVVGVAEIVRAAYADPAAADRRFVVVDVKPIARLARPVTLAEIKANRKLANFVLVKNSRLSIMPVSDAQWAEIERMAASPPK